MKVSNVGFLSVNDVELSCLYKNISSEQSHFSVQGLTVEEPSQNVAEIRSGHPVTLFCQNRLMSIVGTPFDDMEIDVNISFRPSFYPWRKSDTFKFSGVRDPNGVLHWMPH